MKNVFTFAIFLIFLLAYKPLFALSPQRVLYISAYHPGFPTFFQQIEGIRSVFAEQPIKLDVEFMDTKRFPGKNTVNNFHLSLSRKLSSFAPYDAIIVADDNALAFAIENQSELFQKIPIIFLGVNDVNLALQQNDNPYITGVVEAVSMQETIALIQRLHPTTERIVALVDNLPSGQADLKNFYSCRRDFPAIKFSELSLADLTFDTFMEKLRSFSNTDAALLLSVYQDASGETLTFEEGLTLIKINLSRPLYHLWQHGMGQGVLGGKLISHYHQGVAAAEMAMQIFAGTPVKSIAVTRKSPNIYTFDYRELKQFDVSLSSLPKGSQIYNEPRSYYRQHKNIIWASSGIFLGYSLLLFGMSNSISTRKKTEKALQDRENYLHLLIDHSPIGLVLCKMDGSLLSVNPAYANIIGYSIEEALQLTYWDVTPEKYASQEKYQLDQLETTGQYGPYEKEYRHKDGHLVPVRLNGMVLSIDSGKYIWSSVENITVQKEAEKNRQDLEEQLKQAQKMEAIGTLAGGIAHDFNNILSAILGFTELALMNPNCDPKNREYHRHVLDASKRAKDLVMQILLYSRKNETRRTAVRYDQVVNEAAELLKHTIPKSVAINIDIDQRVGTVLANATQLHQVIINLGTNAYHALSGEPGSISINVKPIDIDRATAAKHPGIRTGRYAHLTVIDTGDGMPPEVLARIFDPFFTTKGPGKGTGMGLSVVHGIILNHEGAIWAESRVGRGTTMNILLPLHEEMMDTALYEHEVPEYMHGKEKIMFIDDEPLIAEYGKNYLETLGYQVTAFTSPKEAMQAFSAHPARYDLVITDQTMSEMTGDLFAREAIQARPDIPVILCTGYSDIMNEGKATALGIRSFLLKPVEGQDLAREVRNVLDEAQTQHR